jgi:hypothetical protein
MWRRSPDLEAIGRYRAGCAHQDLSSADSRATQGDRRFKQGLDDGGPTSWTSLEPLQEIPNDAGRLAAIAEKQIEALNAQRPSLIIAPTHGFVVRGIRLVTGLAIAS